MFTENDTNNDTTTTDDAPTSRKLKPIAPLDLTKQPAAAPLPPHWLTSGPITHVWLQHSHYTPTKQLFTVFDATGAVMIRSTDDPEHDACRILFAQGVRGWLVTRWVGSPHYAMRMGVEWGARRFTLENASVGPVVRKLSLADKMNLPEDQREAVLTDQDRTDMLQKPPRLRF